MKVLFLTTHFNVGGVSTYIITLAKHLKQKGIDVVCASCGGALVPELAKLGITHYVVPVNTKNEIHLKLLFAFFRLVEIIDKEEITHLHAHTRVTQVIGQFIKKIRPDIHYLTTCHGFYKRRLLRKLFPAWGDRIIAISDPVREHLVNDFKVKKSTISLVYNGVDPEKFDCKMTLEEKNELKRYFKLNQEGFVIGAVSRLEKVKGYQCLISAIPAILKQYPKTQFILIGEGKYKKQLIKLARSLNVEKNIIFAGRVENVSFALNIIDVFVLPAIWNEGFGLGVLEAMASGKPIVVSNIGGVYALVKEGYNGWLVTPGDINSLVEAIVRLIANEQLMHQMGENSKRFANECFSMKRMSESMATVYQELAAKDRI